MGKIMFLKKILFTTVAALAVAAAPANASTYLFDVLYSGNGVATLAPGSDDPLAVTLAAGDTYTYNLRATGAGQWTTLASGTIFPFFALVGPFGSSTADFTLSLLNNGGTVFSYSEVGAGTCCAHLGTNTVSVTGGLTFDGFSLTSIINSTTASGPADSMLPFSGTPPEAYRPDLIAFAAGAVPEPATWAMMLMGFGVVGAGVRSRRKPTVRLTYA